MKEKVLKYIIELVFIFIIPLALLATCFKQEKVYDENNNEVGKYLTFDNIFILSNDTKTYYNYEYYALTDSLNLSMNDYFYLDLNVNQQIHISNVYKVFFERDNLTYSSTSTSSYVSNESGYWKIEYLSNCAKITRIASGNFVVYCEYGNVVKDIHTYTISDNFINRLLNSLYDTLGITSNWILQFIVIYTLLWLIMWFIWHILYLPLDFICSKLLFDRVDK